MPKSRPHLLVLDVAEHILVGTGPRLMHRRLHEVLRGSCGNVFEVFLEAWPLEACAARLKQFHLAQIICEDGAEFGGVEAPQVTGFVWLLVCWEVVFQFFSIEQGIEYLLAC